MDRQYRSCQEIRVAITHSVMMVDITLRVMVNLQYLSALVKDYYPAPSRGA